MLDYLARDGWRDLCLPEMKWVTSLLGVGLIYSMAKVYQLRTMPAWNTWRTTAGFFITSASAGTVVDDELFGAKSGGLLGELSLVLLAVELGLILSAKPKAQWTVNRLRVGLIAGAMVGAGIMSAVPNPLGMWTSLPIFLMVLVEEIIGRWLFYEALQERVHLVKKTEPVAKTGSVHF